MRTPTNYRGRWAPMVDDFGFKVSKSEHSPSARRRGWNPVRSAALIGKLLVPVPTMTDGFEWSLAWCLPLPLKPSPLVSKRTYGKLLHLNTLSKLPSLYLLSKKASSWKLPPIYIMERISSKSSIRNRKVGSPSQ